VLNAKRTIGAAIAVAAASVTLVAGCGGGDDGPEVTPDPHYSAQPNLLFILSDDQNLAQFTPELMPNTFKLLVDQGTTFTNFYTATPLCCPSRAAMLTGQYGHNNGVLSNVPGYPLLREPENILPDWLDRVGYNTGEVGKWLNGYEKTVDKHKEEPPGWDKWHGLIGAHGYENFKVSNNGKKDIYEGGKPYLTDFIERTTSDLIDKFSRDEKPWYLQVNELAPHVENFQAESKGRCGGEAVPDTRDLGRFPDVQLPDNPAINESDISDKPTFIAGKDPLTKEQLATLRLRYECRAETIYSLDRSIGKIMQALSDSGELDNTVVIFASDNGTFHGEHRLPGGKGLPYDEAAHMPMVMRVPEQFRGGAPVAKEIDEPTLNIDLVPTMVDFAGAPTCVEGEDGSDECRVMDGRSLVDLLAGDDSQWPKDRPLLHELDLNVDALDVGRGISCHYEGVRQGDWLYIRHTSIPEPGIGACVDKTVVEQYDTARDPHELDNLAAEPGRDTAEARAAEERLSKLTDELADCSGIQGRDPEPESGHYCS
jgi:arylsulfatase A-like enzyme